MKNNKNLYAWVSTNADKLLKMFIDRNSEARKLLEEATSDYYYNILGHGIRAYIHGEGPYTGAHEDPFAANSFVLLCRLNDIFSSRVKCDNESLLRIIGEESIHNVKINFLDKFDLHKCEVLVLPDEFYRDLS